MPTRGSLPNARPSGEAAGATAASLLADIAAAPRPAGGDEEARVRALCAERLAAAGFTVSEESFAYSRVPGCWATPLGGLLAAATIAGAGWMGMAGRMPSALGIVLMGIGLLVLGGSALARRVTTLPLARAWSVNLVATRGTPRAWIVAHLDSKSQPVPMLLRVGGIVIASVAIVAIAALAIRGMLGWTTPHEVWRALTVGGCIATIPILGSVVGESSAGAVDDGSGVATVLLAVERLPRELPIGVLLTSAEELGMAGAQAFASERRPASAINIDGVDDAGKIICMRHGLAARPRIGVAHAAAALGLRVSERRTIPGLLTDGVALANAGWSAVTLSRGTLATLARIHRPADRAERVLGTGINEMARLLAQAVREIA
ncbi:MAG TPA: M28 family peptidase [Gemmatimonadaceae bacterium]|nr:M28 family peptidase [Gemmatimonadaceae bacterium]